MTSERKDGPERDVSDGMDERRRAEATALADLARLVEAAEPPFQPHPEPQPRTPRHDR